MTVLTISREYGSEGRRIAEVVAQALGYHFVNKRTIEQILIQYGYVDFYKEYEAAVGFWDRFDPHRAEMVSMLNRVVRGLACHGNMVILGRGSFAVLHGLADVLNVRIKAPLPLRVNRVMQQQGIFNPEQAQTMIVENDRVRATFIENFYGVRWDSSEAFDLVIDTGKIAPDLAATWLIDALKALPGTLNGSALTTQALVIDSVLKVAIASTLKCEVEH